LLPQAFGPFARNDTKKYVKSWVNNADLIFAREIDSFNNLVKIVGNRDKISIAPDFTNLVAGKLPKNFDAVNMRVAVVPNYRMIDKTAKEVSNHYLPFLVRVTRYLAGKGVKVFLLVHEGERDLMLARQVSEAVGGIPVLIEEDPINIKGILGQCDASIGSRFHGLVSALAQGVPSIATGWSHKYYRLFEDYDFANGLVAVNDSDDELFRKIDLITDPATSIEIRRNLLKRSEDLSRKTESMWDLVFKTIEN
jgi:colanic acid/amylovoran biosynthesis protein